VISTTLLLPEAGNDGQPFPTCLFSELESRLLDAGGGGLTVRTGLRGYWLDDTGRAHEDASEREYLVALPLAGIPEWLATLEWAKRLFRQESLFVTLAGQPFLV
jgi:hypothetical protein